VRMYHTILGHGAFYNGLQTFFKQHVGTVSTQALPEQLSSTSPNSRCILCSALAPAVAHACAGCAVKQLSAAKAK
jgi:hypothetical protein